jgi:hypothetical protein
VVVVWSYTEEELWIKSKTDSGLESTGSEEKRKTEENLEKDCCKGGGKML